MLHRIAHFVSGIVDARDPDLAGHHSRMSETAAGFAGYLGMSMEDAELLSIGARIHDLGKLSISDHILNKPARLTAAEFSLVKQHTVIGSQLLAPLDLDSRISDIVRFHHENYDGSGYPAGRFGESIPMFARMVRILDSFDALTTDRPYHRGVSDKEAVSILKRDSFLYDPELLKQFTEMITHTDKSHPRHPAG